MKWLAIPALLAVGLNGCTLVGAGTGASTAALSGGDVKHDAEIGALIGLGCDVIVATYLIIASAKLSNAD